MNEFSPKLTDYSAATCTYCTFPTCILHNYKTCMICNMNMIWNFPKGTNQGYLALSYYTSLCWLNQPISATYILSIYDIHQLTEFTPTFLLPKTYSSKLSSDVAHCYTTREEHTGKPWSHKQEVWFSVPKRYLEKVNISLTKITILIWKELIMVIRRGGGFTFWEHIWIWPNFVLNALFWLF